VLLFRRADRPTGQYRDPEYGWGGLASRLEIHEVPGNHIDMFLDPNVHLMADKLRACLLGTEETNKTKTVGANQS
jgi:thioesterase domain-containing protein